MRRRRETCGSPPTKMWCAGRKPRRLTFWRHQVEMRPLRVYRVHNPHSARHLDGAVEDLTTTLGNAVCAGIDRIDIEIEAPMRHWNLRRLGHHAANRRSARGEKLIDAHGSHVVRFRFGPAKHLGIERKGALPVR